MSAYGHRASRGLADALATCALAACALALDPALAAAQRGPFELGVLLENDNLLLGAYRGMAGDASDGTDLGRTHSSSIWLGVRWDAHTALRLDVWSGLYTESISGEGVRAGGTLPVRFLELDRFRLGAELGAPGAPWRVRLGSGVEIGNHRYDTIGASGQQIFWHELSYELRGGRAWRFEHRDDGHGVDVGATLDAAAGGGTALAIAPWLAIEAGGLGGARATTLEAGSSLLVEGRVALRIGDPGGARFLLSLEQRADLWLERAGVMLRSTIDARLDLRYVAIDVALNRYDGDQNEAYFFYATPNTTMTIALLARAW